MADRRPWTSPSDLAEFVFCRRAHFYRQRAEAPTTPAMVAGDRFHRRRLASELWRESHPAVPWLAIGLGLVLCLAALLLAGVP